MRRRDYERTTLAVWELTLACNLSCSHCGSRAGTARANELTTGEALDLVEQLAEVGIREVALIGGEAFLRRDWLRIADAISSAGMVCSMTTGGYGISAGTALAMKRAGMRHVSVSVDGLQPTHDKLRGRSGSYDAAFKTMEYLRAAGLLVGVNTQINRLTAPDLLSLYETLKTAGMQGWQLQLTVPSGSAADRPDILLQPYDLPGLWKDLSRIAVRALRDDISIMPGNNIGYHSPYSLLMELAGASSAIGEGCQAGMSTLGIEADGTIKGCPSLPASHYAGGNIRSQRLRDMIRSAPALALNVVARLAPLDALWGFCRTCEFAARCRGGCTWTAHAFFDRPGNNPYCHHRALKLAERGRRERLVQVRRAPGIPFDNGEFRIVEEGLERAETRDGRSGPSSSRRGRPGPTECP